MWLQSLGLGAREKRGEEAVGLAWDAPATAGTTGCMVGFVGARAGRQGWGGGILLEGVRGMAAGVVAEIEGPAAGVGGGGRSSSGAGHGPDRKWRSYTRR